MIENLIDALTILVYVVAVVLVIREFREWT